MGNFKKLCLSILFSILICLLIISSSYLEPSKTGITVKAAQTYTLTINVAGNGTVSENPTSANGTYSSGTTVTLDASPLAGYTFNGWQDDLISTNNPVNVTMTKNMSITATFVLTTYQITVTQSVNGVISPGTATYAQGSSQAETITPNGGYLIASITVDGGAVTVTSSSGQTVNFNNIQAVHSITATFAQITYQITVTQSVNGVISPGTASYAQGSSQAETITPNGGYLIASITVDGGAVTVTSSSGQTVNFNNIQAVHSITATFAQITYQITVTQSVNGVISPGTASYAQGSSQAETITPNGGYLIASITVDGGAVTVTSSSGQTVNFNNIQAVHSITATFAQITYQITVTQSVNGVISPGTASYAQGSSQAETITPNGGYLIASITVDGGAVTVTSSSGQTVNFNNIQAVHSITATFAQITYPVVFATVGGGTTNPAGSQMFTVGQQINISATASTGYSFASWSASPSTSVTFGNTAAALTTATIKGNGTITATFTLNSYTLTIITSGSGNVTLNPSQGPYHYGDIVNLNANPGNGYVFTGWTGGINKTDNPLQINITSSITVTATFTQSNYSISVMVFPSSAAGSIEVSISGPYHNGDTVILTASPTTGYTFSGWSGDGTGTGNTRTVTVTGNMQVSAIFAQITYPVSFATYGGGSDSITSPSGIQQYTLGQVVQINATPGNGYTFSSWQASGSISFDDANSDSTLATINGTGTITAIFTQNPTPTPTSTPVPTPEQTSTTTMPSPSPTPQTTPTSTPSSNKTSETIAALSNDGSVTHIVIYGSLDGADVSNATISDDQSASQTTVTLTLTGQNNPDGLFNITIPKEAVKYGSIPTIYVNNQAAQNQGFTQDASNYYLWYTSYTENYELSITFSGTHGTQIWVAIIVAVIATVLVIAIVIPKIRRQN